MTGSDIKIRLASNKDLGKIIALVESVLPEYGFRLDFETSEADLKDIEATYFQAGGMFAVVENAEGEIIGTCAVLPVDKETCKLRKMYLAPKFRGRGLGRRTLEYAIDFAQKRGCKTVVLETADAMKEAVRLYRRAGFRPIDASAVSPRCNQVYSLELKQRC